MTLTDIEGRAYCEEFAIRLFGRLDSSEKGGGADKLVPPTPRLARCILAELTVRVTAHRGANSFVPFALLTARASAHPVPPTGRWPSISLSRRHSLRF